MDTINGIALEGAQGHRDGDGQSCDGEGQLAGQPPALEQRGEAHGPTICKGVFFSGLGSKLGSRREGCTSPTMVVGEGGRSQDVAPEGLATADRQVRPLPQLRQLSVLPVLPRGGSEGGVPGTLPWSTGLSPPMA